MSAFGKFTYQDWCDYYTSINRGLPAEECLVELNDEKKESYNKALKELEEERKAHPDVPIFYDMPESSWFD